MNVCDRDFFIPKTLVLVKNTQGKSFDNGLSKASEFAKRLDIESVFKTRNISAYAKRKLFHYKSIDEFLADSKTASRVQYLIKW